MKPGCASGSAESFGYVTLVPSAAGFGERLFSDRAADLIAAFAKLSEAERRRTARLFGDMTSLADELGVQVAGATERGARLIAEQKKTTDLLYRLLDASRKKPERVTQAVSKPARRKRWWRR